MEKEITEILATMPKSGDPVKDQLMEDLVRTFFKRGWMACAKAMADAVIPST